MTTTTSTTTRITTRNKISTDSSFISFHLYTHAQKEKESELINLFFYFYPSEIDKRKDKQIHIHK
jgi:hypothetical protein